MAARRDVESLLGEHLDGLSPQEIIDRLYVKAVAQKGMISELEGQNGMLRVRLNRARLMLNHIRQRDNDQNAGWYSTLVNVLAGFVAKEQSREVAAVLSKLHFVRVCIGCGADQGSPPRLSDECPIHGRLP